MADPILASLPSRPAVQTPDRSPAKVARDFEGVFAGQITKIMLETVEQGEDFNGGHGEEMFRGVLAEQIGTQIAKGKGLGIASAVEAQIIRLQGGNGHAQ
ncbi:MULTISPECIES: rod-binding protein [unclassified Novosphingobium]|jgi:Rod binding domain-containing protein|uniref:rod-binding protein n=1 Tax=unclassified Novosphingobium TaxID=2644732 RepID=UPI001065D201|nr:rod-binding protein [Novosphingobium sp. PhB55]TDW65312.1 rod binding protein [Novosphingobium sp. PhB55]